MKIYFSTLLLLLLMCKVGFTQKQIATQYGSWYNYAGTVQLTDKLGLTTLYSWRRADFIQQWQQSLFRIGVNYKLNDAVTFTPGYDWALTYPYGEQAVAAPFNEHRIFEQVGIKTNFGRFYVDHRYRYEQRFLESTSYNADHDRISAGYHFRQRLRYQLSITVPINHKKLEDNTFFVKVSDEAFMNIGKGTALNSFDQNWYNASIGFRFHKDFNATIGYQNQFIIKGDGLHMERNHLLNVGVTYNFDFRKK